MNFRKQGMVVISPSEKLLGIFKQSKTSEGDMVVISSFERFLRIFKQFKTSEGDTVVIEVNKAAKLSGNARITQKNGSVLSPSASVDQGLLQFCIWIH